MANLAEANRAAVIFDFFGTLTESPHRDERNAGHDQVAAALGVPSDAYRQALVASWPDRARGRFGDVEATLARIARACWCRAGRGCARPSRERTPSHQRSYLRLRPATLPTLRTLRENGLRIGLVSDCTRELVEEWPALPVAPLVDVPVFSVVEGVKKPDPEIFHRVCKRFGVPPAECVYVGDGDSHELPGAARANLRPIRLLMPDHANAYVFDPVAWSGAVVPDLSELVADCG